jgi:hypothetical protein
VEPQRVGVDLEEGEQMSDFLKIPAGEPIPLSILELDLPAPTIGWAAGLAEKGVDIVTDDLGRLAVSRADAKRLFDEHREHEARAREVLARNEAAAIEKDRLRRAALPKGLAWYDVPVGLSPAMAMVASDPDRDKRPRRTSVLEDSLAGVGTTMHILPPTPAFEEDES